MQPPESGSTPLLDEVLEEDRLPLPYIIGICGPSGSGKTTACSLVQALVNRLKPTDSEPGSVQVINQDWYYRGGDERTNYDLPKALRLKKLASDLRDLRAGKTISAPGYDFHHHRPIKHRHTVVPSRIIVVEGILLFTREEITQLCDLKVYVDSDAELRYERRLNRDVTERGRTVEEVKERYFRDVLPSTHKYVEPQKRLCDVILVNNVRGKFVGLKVFLSYVKTIVESIWS